jgi:hypothetical protein
MFNSWLDIVNSVKLILFEIVLPIKLKHIKEEELLAMNMPGKNPALLLDFIAGCVRVLHFTGSSPSSCNRFDSRHRKRLDWHDCSRTERDDDRREVIHPQEQMC